MANAKTSTPNDEHLKRAATPDDESLSGVSCERNLSHETSSDAWNNFDSPRGYSEVKLSCASSPVSEDGSGCFDANLLHASTPASYRSSNRKYQSVRITNGLDPRNASFTSEAICVGTDEVGSDAQQQIEVFNQVQVPIVGYETIEERAKFTVFKLQVKRSSYESWYIFRRYSDFERLKRQVKRIFPNVRLTLPPKKWLGGNFETAFLDERMAGLQLFINSIVLNKDINTCAPVRQFLCFDEPPGPYESLEESRAMCESLEDQIYRLTVQLQERDDRIQGLESELKLSREKICEMERTSCSCGSGGASSHKLARELDSNENLTDQL